LPVTSPSVWGVALSGAGGLAAELEAVAVVGVVSRGSRETRCPLRFGAWRRSRRRSRRSSRRHPHLDGEYAIVGRAGAGWDRVAEGDVVEKVRVAK
jgi:hypothetical protein